MLDSVHELGLEARVLTGDSAAAAAAEAAKLGPAKVLLAEDAIDVRQFMQRAGRAGRRGMDDSGYAIVRLDFPHYGQAREHLGTIGRRQA